ncbi:predicted protein [Aspergillus terreus NIH2624]|uniref:Polymerase nucleotidyl transferase domain-containing protein n=1 Tax=Aspergillus terreus (strain NIH 2624 / FGSC A1156) TaxID=341663 RepID=Q0CBG3_ASPTN|nr:uncharacterized protein ATEG_08971 [Aspergillus terreus NIH2624]EAU31103.1 predicted protein [Aspergillus terreus NIH2624]
MRVVLRSIKSPLPFFNTSRRPPLRCLHGTSLLRAKEPVIYKNSLEKTLEAHRVSNRASLIRRVVSKDPVSATTSPDTLSSSEKHVSETDPSTDAPPSREAQPLRRPKTKRHSSQRTTRPSPSASAPSRLVVWSTDRTRGRSAQSPWLDGISASSDSLSQLDAEIRALAKYLTPTIAEQNAISQVTAELTTLLRPAAPHPPVVVGSRRTGFSMSHSDLDLLLPVSDAARSSDSTRKPSASRPQMLELYRETLHKARAVLRQSPSFQEQGHPTGKRHSTLTIVHRPTGVPVQLYCGEGLPASIEYIQDYHAEYPTIHPLYMTLRLILETHGLYGPPSGITSDALLVLLATFLKMNHGRFRGPTPLAAQLLAVLRVYGTEVDLATTGVAADPPCFFNVDSVKEAARTYDPADLPAYLRGQRSLINLKRTAARRRNAPAAARLCLQDPANYMNDLGRGCTRTREIQGVFARAFEELDAALRGWEDTSSGAPDRSVLAHALRANFDSFSRMRARIAAAQDAGR